MHLFHTLFYHLVRFFHSSLALVGTHLLKQNSALILLSYLFVYVYLFSYQSLNIESHLVRVKCIEVLGAVGCPVEGTEDILPVLARFSDDVDSRVRTAVFEALVSDIM